MVLFAVRLALAAVFVVSALAKLADRPGTRRAVGDFGVPAPLRTPAVALLPAAELLAAVLLLGGDVAPLGGALAAALLAAFSAGIAALLARGRQVACHCFGTLSRRPLGPGSLVRNGVLLAAAFAVALAGSDPDRDGYRWLADRTPLELAVIAGAVAVAAAAAALGWLFLGLLRQHGRLLRRVELLERRQLEAAYAGERPGRHVPAALPALTLTDLDGGEHRVADLPDGVRPLLVAFMAPDCAPCQALLPAVTRWGAEHADLLAVVVVARGPAATVREKFAGTGLLVLHDPDGSLDASFGIDGTPGAVLLDRAGALVAGPAYGGDDVTELVAPALGTQPARLHQVQPRPLTVGDPLPEVTVADADGREVVLREILDGDSVLLLWDPDCGFARAIRDDVARWEAGRTSGDPALVVLTRRPLPADGSGFAAPVLLDTGFVAGGRLGAPGTPSAVRVDAAGRLASPVAAGGPDVLALLEAAVSAKPRAAAAAAG